MYRCACLLAFPSQHQRWPSLLSKDCTSPLHMATWKRKRTYDRDEPQECSCTRVVGFVISCCSLHAKHSMPCLLLQPYVMLGLELQQRGHEVVLATEQRMEPLVKQLGQGRLRFFKISGDPTLMIYGKKNQVHTGAAQPRACT